MAKKYDMVLYDEESFATTGSPRELFLFQTRVGSTTAKGEANTNCPYAGVVDASEKMTIHGMALDYDPDISVADLQNLIEDSFLEIKVKDTRVFHGPLRALPQLAAFQGHFLQASAADQQMVGLAGNVYMLRNKIEVGPGDRYQVRLVQATNLVAAADVRIMLLVDIEEAGG